MTYALSLDAKQGGFREEVCAASYSLTPLEACAQSASDGAPLHLTPASALHRDKLMDDIRLEALQILPGYATRSATPAESFVPEAAQGIDLRKTSQGECRPKLLCADAQIRVVPHQL